MRALAGALINELINDAAVAAGGRLGTWTYMRMCGAQLCMRQEEDLAGPRLQCVQCTVSPLVSLALLSLWEVEVGLLLPLRDGECVV